LSSGALGTGLGGLAALGGLVLLLFLFKKKKKEPDRAEETPGLESTTIGELDEYISEYGLSDAGQPVDGEDDKDDLPQVGYSGDAVGRDFDCASEHNPDEIEDIRNDLYE
jgi:hypothetical protein